MTCSSERAWIRVKVLTEISEHLWRDHVSIPNPEQAAVETENEIMRREEAIRLAKRLEKEAERWADFAIRKEALAEDVEYERRQAGK